MLLTCLLLSSGCGLFRSPKIKLSVLPADRVIKALPGGNYEVTPAWLQDRYEYERAITQQLTDCRKKAQ